MSNIALHAFSLYVFEHFISQSEVSHKGTHCLK